jgi:hypothetical protein
MKIKIRLNTTIETESLTTRVALHPFLAGMGSHAARIAYRLRDGGSF